MEKWKEKLKDTAYDQKVFETEVARTIQKEENKKEKKRQKKTSLSQRQKMIIQYAKWKRRGFQDINLDTYSKILAEDIKKVKLPQKIRIYCSNKQKRHGAHILEGNREGIKQISKICIFYILFTIFGFARSLLLCSGFLQLQRLPFNVVCRLLTAVGLLLQLPGSRVFRLQQLWCSGPATLQYIESSQTKD